MKNHVFIKRVIAYLAAKSWHVCHKEMMISIGTTLQKQLLNLEAMQQT